MCDTVTFPAFTEKISAFTLVMEVESAVNPPVGPFLLFGWTSPDQTESPPLELIRVLLRQSGCILRGWPVLR